MATEADVKTALKEAKGPSLKKYVLVLLILAAVVAAYFLLSETLQVGEVKTASQAQNVEGNIQEGVQNISSDLDAISGILGIS